MSILIKSLDMPKNCLECPLQFGGWCYCCPPDIDGKIAETVEKAAKQGKPDWCPLIEFKTDDVVPVIRCYECEKFIPFMNDERGFCSEHHIRAYPIGYCSNGIRPVGSEVNNNE